MAQRDGRDRDDGVLPLQVVQVPVRFQAMDASFAVGDQLAVTVAQDNPWFMPNAYPVTAILDGRSTLTIPELPATPGLETAAYMAQNPYRGA